MSLSSRLASLIAAIGADIGAINAAISGLQSGGGIKEHGAGNTADVVYATLTAATPHERFLFSAKSGADKTITPDGSTGSTNWDYANGMVDSDLSPNLLALGYYKLDQSANHKIGTVWSSYRCKVAGTTALPTGVTDANWELQPDVPAKTGRTTTAADTATSADLGNIVILADGHTPTLFAETASAHQWKTITYFSEGATELTFAAGGTTVNGNTKINQNETVTATLVAVGATTGTVWYLTGGSA